MCLWLKRSKLVQLFYGVLYGTTEMAFPFSRTWFCSEVKRSVAELPCPINPCSISALHLINSLHILEHKILVWKMRIITLLRHSYWNKIMFINCWKLSVDTIVDQLKSCALGTRVPTCSNTNTLTKAKYTSILRSSKLCPQYIDTQEEGVPTAIQTTSLAPLFITHQTGQYLNIQHWDQGKQTVVCPNTSEIK